METNKKVLYAVLAVLGTLLLAMAISPSFKQEPDTITVSAAASLTEAFTDIATQFEKENPGTNVSLNFGGSGSLRMQIEGGAQVDVFASADESQMNVLGNKTLIDNSSRKDFARNSLVLIVPEGSTFNITGLKDLADSKIEKISICNPETAHAGKYARLALTEAGLWDGVGKKLVLADDVKQSLVYVERGEVDAGFVHMTDAKTAQSGTIKIIADVPASTPITYPIAVVSSSENKGIAKKFLDYITGEKGQTTLNKYGFKAP